MAKVNLIRFSSKYQDDQSDWLYYGYRYYKPSTGNWLSRDPVGEKGFKVSSKDTKRMHTSMNLSAFVNNSPIDSYVFLGLRPHDSCCRCEADVTDATLRTLESISWLFHLCDDNTAYPACKQLVNHHGAYAHAWDIQELASYGFDLKSCDCKRTVTFNGHCYYGGALNYVKWGRTCKLSQQRFGDLPWDISVFEVLAAAHKELETPGGLDREGRKAVEFTFDGYDGTLIVGNNDDHCKPSGYEAIPYAFHWIWRPAKPNGRPHHEE